MDSANWPQGSAMQNLWAMQNLCCHDVQQSCWRATAAAQQSRRQPQQELSLQCFAPGAVRRLGPARVRPVQPATGTGCLQQPPAQHFLPGGAAAADPAAAATPAAAAAGPAAQAGQPPGCCLVQPGSQALQQQLHLGPSQPPDNSGRGKKSKSGDSKASSTCPPASSAIPGMGSHRLQAEPSCWA